MTTTGALPSPTRQTGHKTLLLKWEACSQLSQKQQDLCTEVESLLASNKFPSQAQSSIRKSIVPPVPEVNLKDIPGLKGPESPDTSSSGDKNNGLRFSMGEELEALAKVKTAEDFRSWYEEMERHLDETNEKKYHSLIEGLREGRASCGNLKEMLLDSGKDLLSIKQGRELISETTLKLKAACENLVSERKKHVELADALRQRLTYFEELETLSVKFGGGRDAISPSDADFLKLLHRLDECIAYASSSTGAVAEADGYLARFLDLQRRAFTLMKEYTTSEFKSVTQQVVKELKEKGTTPFGPNNLTDASREYLKFRTIAPRIKSLMAELHSRTQDKLAIGRRGAPGAPGSSSLFSTRNFAISLLGDCEECFVEQRRRLLEQRVSQYIKSLANSQQMIDLARSGSSFTLHICQVESNLYSHLFCTEEEKDSPALLSLLDTFCNILYEELRSRVLQESDLDTLVYLIEILRTEVLSIDVPKKTVSLTSFASATSRMVADAQERIIYRAQIFIQDEIKNFVPTPSNLDYPDVILNFTRSDSTVSEGMSPRNADESRGLYSTWYPPLERTLRLLTMLYRCVDGEVFAGIASEAVAVCVACLRSASSKIAASGKEKAEDHAEIFLIWQMLLLREQTSPFDVNFAFVDRELNFTELRNLLGNVIRGQVSVRALAAPPAAMKEKIIDSSQELERGFFEACEVYVLRLTRMFLDPILSFLAKCNALPSNSNTPLRVPDSPSTAGMDRKTFESLKQTEGSFLHPETVQEMWTKTEEHIRSDLQTVVKTLKIYIAKSSSTAILLRPVRANFSEAFNELLSALQTRYTLEEREQMRIDGKRMEELLARVDEIMEL